MPKMKLTFQCCGEFLSFVRFVEDSNDIKYCPMFNSGKSCNFVATSNMHMADKTASQLVSLSK